MATFKIKRERLESQMGKDLLFLNHEMVVDYITRVVIGAGYPVNKNIIIELDSHEDPNMVKIIVSWEALDTNMSNRVKSYIRFKSLKNTARSLFNAS
jgi:hypothetical protein